MSSTHPPSTARPLVTSPERSEQGAFSSLAVHDESGAVQIASAILWGASAVTKVNGPASFRGRWRNWSACSLSWAVLPGELGL